LPNSLALTEPAPSRRIRAVDGSHSRSRGHGRPEALVLRSAG